MLLRLVFDQNEKIMGPKKLKLKSNNKKCHKCFQKSQQTLNYNDNFFFIYNLIITIGRDI